MSDERAATNLDALIRPQGCALSSGIVLRPLSAGVVTIARKFRLRLLSADPELRAGLAGDELELEIYAIAWLMFVPPSEAWRATRVPWEDFRDATLLPWIFALAAVDLPILLEEITRSLAEIGEAAVEPVPKSGPAGESPPPNT